MARTAKPGRWSRAILATLAIVVLSAGTAELAARQFFGMMTLQYRWSYQPLFVTGDYHYLMPNEQLPFVAGGPVAMGYRAAGFGYHYDLAAPLPHSASTFGDFLFAHNRARYDAAEVDRISCAEPDAMLIHVLGGSVAQGFSAEDKQSTWHNRLEQLLRRRLGRQDVYIFNAAMGGFVSLQERLAYHLVVAPRRANLVLIVDGYNDVTLSANSGVRPGDPIQLGLRFSQMFGDGFMWWLARHSAIANTVLQNEFNDHVTRFRDRLARDEELFGRYARSIVDIYLENMSDVLNACEGRGQTCLVGIQPARSLTAEYLGTRIDDVLPQKRIVQLYRQLLDRIAASPLAPKFIDLTHVFDRGEKLQNYADSVHPNFAGQQVLAQALLEPSLAALRSAKSTPPPVDRCTPR